MQNEFKMSMMWDLKYFLELLIHQIKGGTFINQAKYWKDLQTRFDIEKANILATPMLASCSLGKEKYGKVVDERKYWGMINSIIYLTTSRSDIMFVICVCACFQASPKELHPSVIKRIMRYFTGIQQMGLWYHKGADCDIVGYSDSDFPGCKLDRKKYQRYVSLTWKLACLMA